MERRHFALLALNAFQISSELKALVDTISIKIFPMVSFLWGEAEMLSICLACQFDRLSCGVLVQVASSSRGFLPNLVGFVSLDSPSPLQQHQDAENTVLVSAACIEIPCGCGQCIFLTCSCLPQPPNVGSGERFSMSEYQPCGVCTCWNVLLMQKSLAIVLSLSFLSSRLFCCRSQDCSLVLGNALVHELVEEKRSFDCVFCELLKFTRLCMTTEDLTQKPSSP